MSTKQTTNSTNTLNYDPTAKGAYTNLIGQGATALTDFIQNPLQSTFFNNMLGTAYKAAGQQGTARNSNIFGNLAASGMSGKALPGFTSSLLAAGSRATSANKSASLNSLLNTAYQARLGATGQAMSFQPLMTGSQGTSTTTTGGLGSWLPQLAGAAIGGVTGLGMRSVSGPSGMPSMAPAGLNPLTMNPQFGFPGNNGTMLNPFSLNQMPNSSAYGI